MSLNETHGYEAHTIPIQSVQLDFLADEQIKKYRYQRVEKMNLLAFL